MPLHAATEFSRLPTAIRHPFRVRTVDLYAQSSAEVDILPPFPRRVPAIRVAPSPALPLPVRRFLSVIEAADYVCVSVTTFREEVEAGMWPGPMRRGKSGRALTWDVRALDKAADAMAGIVPIETVAEHADALKKAATAALMTRLK